MSSNKCARCEQTVYPVEGLRCLDKLWHKGCFKCHECGMTLNMKNYKGFEKRPYCNAHCPQAKATTVADTPEIRRLAENTRIQSQAKYHEDFEKSKGKGFTAIADDSEIQRLKETSKIVSNVAYHGEIERKKQMEEKRSSKQTDEEELTRQVSAISIGSNNNSVKHQNRMQQNNLSQSFDHHSVSPVHHIQGANQTQLQQQQQHYQKMQNSRQLIQVQHQQQHLLKQQQHPQLVKQPQQQYAPSYNGQPNRISGQYDAPVANQKSIPGHIQQQQLKHHQQQQQQLMMRHQQQFMAQQQSQPIELSNQRQPSQKQAVLNHNQGQHMIKHPSQVNANHQPQQIKYVSSANNAIGNQAMPAHFVNVPNQIVGVSNGQRVISNVAANNLGAHVAPNQQQSRHGFNAPQMAYMNGILPKQQQQFVGTNLPAHIMNHPGQMQQTVGHLPQTRPMGILQLQQLPQQVLQHQPVPRRVFRAMYDYVANDPDEVSFFENDILIDCVNVDRNWLVGMVARSGQTGMLPANYVAELQSQ